MSKRLLKYADTKLVNKYIWVYHRYDELLKLQIELDTQQGKASVIYLMNY